MKFYPHNINDFIADTARLPDSACMAYLRMIWKYYDSESPLENDADAIAFEIGANASDVHQILKRFFFLHNDGFWHHSRCDKVILEFYGKSDKAREAAKTRWKNADAVRKSSKRIEKECERIEKECGSNATHNPKDITKEKDQNTSSSGLRPDEMKPKTKKSSYTEDDLKIATWMFNRIKQMDPTAKEPKLDSWGNEIRLMRECDNRSLHDIGQLFDFANRDPFWRTNILSPATLRKQWQKVHLKRTQSPRPIQTTQSERDRVASAIWGAVAPSQNNQESFDGRTFENE